MISPKKRTARVRVTRVGERSALGVPDVVAVEEPLEIRIEVTAGPEVAEHPVAVTMRTPGDDFELAAGFLFTEGIIADRRAIAELRYCGSVEPQEYNVVTVRVRDASAFDATLLNRNFYVTSSCGVCGKASLEAVENLGCAPLPEGCIEVAESVLAATPSALLEGQTVFERTGGIHAAGLFDAGGRLILLREDVGRHNAVDKVVGHQFLEGGTPLLDRYLAVSGRASFEIMQKALMAGVPMVVAVGAPSSLAVDFARRFSMTLVGFTKASGFNVYSGRARVRAPGLAAGVVPSEGATDT